MSIPRTLLVTLASAALVAAGLSGAQAATRKPAPTPRPTAVAVPVPRTTAVPAQVATARPALPQRRQPSFTG